MTQQLQPWQSTRRDYAAAMGRRTPPSRARTVLARSRAWARPAGVGTRILAFLIDAVAVAAVGAAVGFPTQSLLLTAVAAAEAAVILVVLEARTGATLGKLAMRMRTTRDDSPFSIGLLRQALRALLQALATAFAVIGGAIMEVTAAADPLKAGRSWADRPARAMVVKVPTRADREAEAQRAATLAGAGPRVVIQRPGASAVELRAVPQRQYTVRTPHPSVSAPGVLPTAASFPTPQLPATPGAPLVADAAPAASVASLLLTFDTGQREQLSGRTAINLGRRPDPREPDDQLLAVADPEGTVSKTHLRIECRGDAVWVIDQGSTNGSEIVGDGEGRVLAPGERVLLDDDARVRIGHRTFTIALIESN